MKPKAKFTMQPVTEYEQCCYIPCTCNLQCWDIMITGGCLDYLQVASVLGFACQVGEGVSLKLLLV